MQESRRVSAKYRRSFLQSQEEAAAAVEKLGQDIYTLKGRLMALHGKLVSEKIASLPTACENVCIFADELDAPAMRRAVQSDDRAP